MLSIQTAMKCRPEKPLKAFLHYQDSKQQMENEVKVLRTELENTKKALKVQMARCRNLVAAFTRKLAEREAEVVSCRELRDKQLSSVLRALLILEARLKREQKSIRVQLAEKDNIINNQQIEIEQLKASIIKGISEDKEEDNKEVVETSSKETEVFITDRECYAKPDLITSLGIDGDERLEEDSPTPSLRYDHPPDSLSSDTASTRSCLGDTSDSDFPSTSHSKSLLRSHDKSAFSPINKSLSRNNFSGTLKLDPETVREHTIKAEKEAEMSAKNELLQEHDTQNIISVGRSMRHLPSTLLQEVRIGARSGYKNAFQDNPVLQCVNQILLKDHEDFLEEQRSLRILGFDIERMEKDGPDCPEWLAADADLSYSEEKEQELPKRSPSPTKANSLGGQEKSCIKLPNRLSVARIPDLESAEIQHINKHHLAKKSISLTDLTKGKIIPRPNPPLPPKPNKLLKRVVFGIEKRRYFRPTTVLFHNPSMVLPPPRSVRIDMTEIDIMNKQSSLPLSLLDPIDQGTDNELYVISNSALDDDIVRQLRNRSVNESRLDITLHPPRLSSDAIHSRTQHSNLPNGLLHPSHKNKAKNKGMHNNIDLFSAANNIFSNHISPGKLNNNLNGILKNNRAPEIKHNFSFVSPPKGGLPPSAIKVASPVATLLTSGKAQESPLQVKDEISPSVSQIVRRFEHLGTPRKNTSNQEEGVGEEVVEEKEKPEGEATSVSYDTFLEATGLSQKSIMTPSRMLSNHKSVLKPKDVKHRSRVKAAAIVEKVIPTTVVGPTIKYWTEPYL